MTKGQEIDYMLGAPVQMMVEEEEIPAQGKAIQRSGIEEEEELQMKESSSNGEQSTGSSAGIKTSLLKDVNTKMENSFGTSFANLNIH